MPVGKTKDAGWQIGVSATLPHPATAVWKVLRSPEGTAVWLGGAVELGERAGEGYRTPDGTVGELRSHHPGERIRLTWRPADWDHDTTVQVTLEDKGDRTALRFHQERLADADERERQRAHWRSVIARLRPLLDEAT